MANMKDQMWEFFFCFILVCSVGVWDFFPSPRKYIFLLLVLTPSLQNSRNLFLELVLGFINSRAQKKQGDKGNFVVAQGTLFIAPHSCCYKRIVGLFFFLRCHYKMLFEWFNAAEILSHFKQNFLHILFNQHYSYFSQSLLYSTEVKLFLRLFFKSLKVMFSSPSENCVPDSDTHFL